MRPTAKQIQQAIDTLQSALVAAYGDAAACAGIGEIRNSRKLDKHSFLC